MDKGHSYRPSPAELDAIERDLDNPPPPPPEPEYVNGAMRSFTGRFVSEVAPVLDDFARNTSPLEALRGVARLRAKTDELTRVAVAIARAYDWPWRDIGEMLGIGASAAYRRYGPDDKKRARPNGRALMDLRFTLACQLRPVDPPRRRTRSVV